MRSVEHLGDGFDGLRYYVGRVNELMIQWGMIVS